jgi:hypothetical protein
VDRLIKEAAVKPLLLLGLLTLFAFSSYAQTWLTPLDFGLRPADHGRIDYRHTPPNVLVGHFNNDSYPDIARFTGNTLEIYYFQDQGYPCRPQATKSYPQPIKSFAHDNNPWDNVDNIVVILQDGYKQTVWKKGGWLDLEISEGFLPVSWKNSPPRQICDFDFQMTWESEGHPWGMDNVAVGDLDNDGINELVTWWKDSLYADTAYMLIYKSIGNNQYDLFMQEPFWDMFPSPYAPALNFLLISDLDQNGQKELIFTCQYCYFWEFSAPGVYTAYHSVFSFLTAVRDLKIGDINQNGILELIQVGGTPSLPHPGSYQVEEFAGKNPQNHVFGFNTLGAVVQDWIDITIAVGDFNNDGIPEIVSGYGGPLYCWYDTWIQYFTYDAGAVHPLVQHWMAPGVYSVCANPVIGDFDNDSLNELYTAGPGGFSPSSNGTGAAYIWKRTSTDTGQVVWWDTTSMFFSPSGVAAGRVDSVLCINNNVHYWDFNYFTLFGYQNNHYQCLWQSPYFYDRYFLWSMSFSDLDQDGKMEFVDGEVILPAPVTWKICDWEQTSSVIGFQPVETQPQSFILNPISPNPFNHDTDISFELPTQSNVEITIYDIAGRMILDRKLNNLSPGNHSFNWQADYLSSGLYLITLHAAGQHFTQKAVLLK